MIAISLRTEQSVSYFRRNLIKILSYPYFTKVIICSGYFQEGQWSYNVLNDGILSTILSNANHKSIEYVIIGAKFYGPKDPWKIDFNNFLKSLKSNQINFKAYIEKRAKWHAKITIGIEDKVPKTILIGSSNLTKPAFNEPYINFNVEADVLLIVNEPKLIRHFNLQDNSNENPLSQIIAQLSPEFNQANIESRLVAINNELLGDNINLLEEYNDFE